MGRHVDRVWFNAKGHFDRSALDGKNFGGPASSAAVDQHGMKLSKNATVVEGFEKFGYPPAAILPIGVVELVSVLLYVIPRTSILVLCC